MSNTFNLGLPLLEASQAQKHVTVNEALVGVDALSQLVLQSVSMVVPPVTPVDGAVYAVPSGAQGAWSGFDGKIAAYSNGGWVYFLPKAGWRAWLIEEDAEVVFDGVSWRSVAFGMSSSGAATNLAPIEFTHSVTPGSTNETAVHIPASSVVLGITGRVISEISGTLASWRLGVAGSDDRYGTGLGSATNSYARGLTGTPLTYYADTPLVLTAEGGEFAAGEVTLVIHVMQLDLPQTV
ncbi:DUF2793 domain-containing protein [Tropicimonas sp. S265A]|uniref:DUF2793 domain-containing protein n=1 Tax=Tropicimonas sp. S265A TaxID=3415134 RepID=UPI003C79D562